MSRDCYASYPDITARLSMVATFTATSRPNASQVQTFLEDSSNEIDAVLSSADYLVPVPTSATAAQMIMRGWTAVGAAWRTAAGMPQGKDSKHVELYYQEWTAILKGIRSGELVLPGSGKDSSTSNARFPVPDPCGVGASPYFSRDSLYDY